MKNMRRSAAIKYAASLPKGDPTRRKILGKLGADTKTAAVTIKDIEQGSKPREPNPRLASFGPQVNARFIERAPKGTRVVKKALPGMSGTLKHPVYVKQADGTWMQEYVIYEDVPSGETKWYRSKNRNVITTTKPGTSPYDISSWYEDLRHNRLYRVASDNMSRSASIKYAASLPKGDPTRREILGMLKQGGSYTVKLFNKDGVTITARQIKAACDKAGWDTSFFDFSKIEFDTSVDKLSMTREPHNYHAIWRVYPPGEYGNRRSEYVYGYVYIGMSVSAKGITVVSSMTVKV